MTPLDVARESEQLATAVRTYLEARETMVSPEGREEATRKAREKAVELLFSANFTLASCLCISDPLPVGFECGCTYHPEPDIDGIAPWLEHCLSHRRFANNGDRRGEDGGS